LLSVASELQFVAKVARPVEEPRSLAERIADVVDVPVVAGLHTLAAIPLGKSRLDEDAFVCGDDESAKELALELAAKLITGRAIDAGPLGLEPSTLVGFENHSGKTYLGPGLQPLGRVLRGAGNNGEDGGEGVVDGNVFGTYLHGSLLPKNPHFADLLIARALSRLTPFALAPLGATEELEAHRAVSDRLLGQPARTRP